MCKQALHKNQESLILPYWGLASSILRPQYGNKCHHVRNNSCHRRHGHNPPPSQYQTRPHCRPLLRPCYKRPDHRLREQICRILDDCIDTILDDAFPNLENYLQSKQLSESKVQNLVYMTALRLFWHQPTAKHLHCYDLGLLLRTSTSSKTIFIFMVSASWWVQMFYFIYLPFMQFQNIKLTNINNVGDVKSRVKSVILMSSEMLRFFALTRILVMWAVHLKVWGTSRPQRSRSGTFFETFPQFLRYSRPSNEGWEVKAPGRENDLVETSSEVQ